MASGPKETTGKAVDEYMEVVTKVIPSIILIKCIHLDLNLRSKFTNEFMFGS